MAITLATGINATVQNVTLSADLTAKPGDLFRLGDECVQFSGYQGNKHGERKYVVFLRGRERTTAASHLSGVSLLGVNDAFVSGASEVTPGPFTSAGGGAVDSVNGDTGVVVLDAADVGAVPTARTITAGTGLTGGGDLTANRTLAPDFGTAAGKVTQGNDARLSDARAPNGAAGGDLSGTYPNPGVVDDSHAHTSATAPGGVPTMPTLAEVLVAGSDAEGGSLTNVNVLGPVATLTDVVSQTGLAGDVPTAAGDDTWQWLSVLLAIRLRDSGNVALSGETVSANKGAKLSLGKGAAGTGELDGAVGFLQGGDGDTGQNGGVAFVAGGNGDNNNSRGAYIDALGGRPDGTSGKLQIGTGDFPGFPGTPNTGVAGDLLSADGLGNTIWQGIVALVLASDFSSLPTADPAVAGALWVDTAASFVVKVSQG